MACAEGSQQPRAVLAGATSVAVAATGFSRGPPGSVECELECLVCREPYSFARSPKLLNCQHTFCAVCLKLLLCVQEDTWSITCPLCRKLTAVPGGLICSLRNQEEVVGWLAQPCREVQLCPQELTGPAASATVLPSSVGEDGPGTVSANRVAARRLAAHLLLLALLIFVILPFIYPGVIRWVLALIIALALLMSMLFCCHPHSLGTPRTLFRGEQKHSEITSIA